MPASTSSTPSQRVPPRRVPSEAATSAAATKTAKHVETVDITSQLSQPARTALDRLADVGLDLPPQPKDSMPTLDGLELSEMTDRKLMNLLAQCTRWEDYSSGQVALAEINEQQAEIQLKLAKDRALILSPPSKGEVTVGKASRDTDPIVVKAQENYDIAYAYRKIVSVLYTKCSRDGATVSRELTRRVGRESREGRADRFRP